MSETSGDGDFSARDAAAILEQASTRARRQFDPYPPQMTLARAVIALASYGAVWLSVRGQHPYTGPTAVAIVIVIALAMVNLGAALLIARRAVSGVRGRTPLRPAEIVIVAVAWIGVFAVMAGLAAGGASRGVYLGWFVAGVPLIVAGLAWAGITAARADWPQASTALVIAAVGAASASAGPVGAWAVAGAGLCAALIGKAAVIAWRQRAGAIRR